MPVSYASELSGEFIEGRKPLVSRGKTDISVRYVRVLVPMFFRLREGREAPEYRNSEAPAVLEGDGR